MVARQAQILKDSVFKEPDHYANRTDAVGVVVGTDWVARSFELVKQFRP